MERTSPAEIRVRPYRPADVPAMAEIWNEIVEEGVAFPQEEYLTAETAPGFFGEQSRCAVAETPAGEILGLYILHPNNLGRCGHIGNASFAVAGKSRGRRVGEALVRDCLAAAPGCGFSLMQFNAVVETNVYARRLYEKLGFRLLGTIPGGFRLKSGAYADICLYYILLPNGGDDPPASGGAAGELQP